MWAGGIQCHLMARSRYEYILGGKSKHYLIGRGHQPGLEVTQQEHSNIDRGEQKQKKKKHGRAVINNDRSEMTGIRITLLQTIYLYLEAWLLSGTPADHMLYFVATAHLDCRPRPQKTLSQYSVGRHRIKRTGDI